MAILPPDARGASHEFVRRLEAARDGEQRAEVVRQIRGFFRGWRAMGTYKDYCRCGAFLFLRDADRVGRGDECPACAAAGEQKGASIS